MIRKCQGTEIFRWIGHHAGMHNILIQQVLLYDDDIHNSAKMSNDKHDKQEFGYFKFVTVDNCNNSKSAIKQVNLAFSFIAFIHL